MSVDTTFKPLGATTLIGVAALQLAGSAQGNPSGINTVRVRCLVTGYFTWGNSSITSPVAPTAGSPVANTIGMTAGVPAEHFEIPAGAYFIASAAAAFEMTPGTGGT